MSKKRTVRFWKNESGYYVKSINFKIGSKMVTKNSIFWDYDKLQKSINKSIKSGYTQCN